MDSRFRGNDGVVAYTCVKEKRGEILGLKTVANYTIENRAFRLPKALRLITARNTLHSNRHRYSRRPPFTLDAKPTRYVDAWKGWELLLS